MADWTPADLLPGLLVAVLAVTLVTVLRRWYDPLPASTLAVFAAVLVLLFGRCLFLGGVLLPLANLQHFPPFDGLGASGVHGNYLQGDLIHQIAPYRAAVRAALADGAWPQRAEIGAGMPLLADPQAQALQPLTWLVLPLSLGAAAGALAALRVGLALVFTFLFLRGQGAGEMPAAAGALAYGLGGFLQLWLGWPIATSAALLPALLYAIDRALDKGQRRDLALLIAVAMTLMLSGHPETAGYAFLAGAVLALARLRTLVAEAAADGAAVAFRSGLRLLAAVAVAAGLAAPALLPTALYLPQTVRVAHTAEVPQEKKAPSPRLEVRAAAPPTTRLAPDDATLERRLLPLIAPFTFGNNRFTRFWGELNVNESAASGFAGSATLLAALLAVVLLLAGGRPVLSHERLVALFGGIVLGLILQRPLGLDLTGGIPIVGPYLTLTRRLYGILACAVVYLAVAALERWRRGELDGRRRWLVAILAAALAAATVHAYGFHPEPLVGTMSDFQRHWLKIQLLTFAGAGVALVAGSRWRRSALAVYAGLIAAELLVLFGPTTPSHEKRLLFPSPPPLAFLEDRLADHPEGVRMLSLGEALPANFALAYDFPDIRLYNPLEPLAYNRLMGTVRADGEWLSTRVRARRLAPGIRLLDTLGARYLLTTPQIHRPAGFRLLFDDPAGRVWERRRARPLLQLDLDSTDGPQADDDALSSFVVTPTRLAATATVEGPRSLRGAVYQDSGWRLLVDGVLQPSEVEQGVFPVARLGAGRHRVEWLYRSPGLAAGVLLAALALAAALAGGLPPPAAARPSGSRRTT